MDALETLNEIMREVVLEVLEVHRKDLSKDIDIGDVGNVIGIALGMQGMKSDSAEFENFVRGVRHGISLKDGTHF